MTRRHRSARARDRNRNLGKAYDLLHAHGIWFYNDRRERGRSLKPLVPVGRALDRQLVTLADHVAMTPIRVGDRGAPVGGERRYWFYLTD
jgi:hypothetical protein